MASLFNGSSVSPPLTLPSFSSVGSGGGESLPTLPFDLIVEILYRLSVKVLVQLRCVCKSWNSTISDPKFARKHLSHSTILGLHFLSYFQPQPRLKPYILHTFSDFITTDLTQLAYPQNIFNGDYYILTGLNYFVGSCHGLLCFSNHIGSLIIIWNPAIRKVNELPLFQTPDTSTKYGFGFGFGYHHVNDFYKVVVLLISVEKTQVKVHTLGTDYWKTIQEFPFTGVNVRGSGQFVSGSIYWLAYWEGPCFIVSFDLEKESFRQILVSDDRRVLYDLYD